MRKDEMNNEADNGNGSGHAVRNETVSPVQSPQVIYTPKEMSDYVQFRINSFNEKARKLYDVLVTEKSIKDFKEEASAITSGFMEKVREIVDLPTMQLVIDDIKSKPTQLKKESFAFYKDITGSLKKTYYSLVWLYANYPNSELKMRSCDNHSAVNAKTAATVR